MKAALLFAALVALSSCSLYDGAPAPRKRAEEVVGHRGGVVVRAGEEQPLFTGSAADLGAFHPAAAAKAPAPASAPAPTCDPAEPGCTPLGAGAASTPTPAPGGSAAPATPDTH